MSIRFYYVVTILLLLCGCTCHEDPDFKREFFNSIEIVQAIHIERNSYETKYRIQSVEVLSAITGHKTRAYTHNETYFYLYKGDLVKDIEAWKSWYNKNHCGFTLEQANEIIRKHDEDNLNINLDWPPDIKTLKEVYREIEI